MENRVRYLCRKLAALLSAAMLLSCFMVSEGHADALYEWNRSCRRKMSQTTTVYEDSDPTRAIDTIPAGTYVQVRTKTEHRAWIVYMKSDGVLRDGYVSPDTIGSAVISFTDADGDRRGIQELQYYELYGNNPPPGGVLDKPLPGGNGQTAGKPTSGGNGQTASSGSTGSRRKNSPQSAAASNVNTDVLWQGSKVSVKTWGFHSSVILAEGREQIVPTHDLTFSEKVDAARRVACIHAPRTGRCSLRSKASGKGDVLDKCPAGTVVQVVQYGKGYCLIVFEGRVGYVQTDCLRFADPRAEPMGTWRLSYNGKMTGNAQVPLRSGQSNDSVIAAKLRSGTEVTVFAKAGSWYEIEHDGIHGYVHKNFLIMDE